MEEGKNACVLVKLQERYMREVAALEEPSFRSQFWLHFFVVVLVGYFSMFLRLFSTLVLERLKNKIAEPAIVVP